MGIAGHSAGGAWNAFYVLQLINYMPLISLTLPSCALYFFRYYDWFNLQEVRLATFIDKVMCDDGVYPEGMLAPTYNFEKMGFRSRYFLLNWRDTIVFITFLSMIIPFISIL